MLGSGHSKVSTGYLEISMKLGNLRRGCVLGLDLGKYEPGKIPASVAVWIRVHALLRFFNTV